MIIFFIFIAIILTVMQTNSQISEPTMPDSLILIREDLLEQQSEDEESYEDNKENFECKISIRSRMIHREQKGIGYYNGYYNGSIDKIYNRFSFKINRQTTGNFLIEKDAGESFKNRFTGFNFTSMDVNQFIRKIIFGDYRLEFGQGLILWSGSSFQKGSDIVAPVNRKSRGIISTISADETYFYRGFAVETRWRSLNISLFISSVGRTANLDTNGKIISFDMSGYFRTRNELKRRYNTNQTLSGGRIVYEFLNHNYVGLLLLNTTYSRKFSQNNSTKYYQQPARTISADFKLSGKEISFYGEMVMTSSLISGTGTILIYTGKNITLVFSCRFYPEMKQPFAMPFGERGEKEIGLYSGIRYNPFNVLHLSFYYDQYKKLDLNYFPLYGYDFLTDVKYYLKRKLSFVFNYRKRVNESHYLIKNSAGLIEKIIGWNYRQRFRLTVDYKITSSIITRARMEINRYSDEINSRNKSGFMVYHDMYFKIRKYLSINLRGIYFKNDCNETVSYELERDLDGVRSQINLYGEGVKFYLLASYNLKNCLKISGKYSVLLRDDVLKIGTGQETLPGNRDSRISVQVDVNL